MRPISYNCRYFLGDRPCIWHKKERVICECEHFEPLEGTILIIKLDAMGDVLRTTCLLPVLAGNWPQSGIAWVTREESVPLLENNTFVTEILPYGADALAHLSSRTFERVINLDASKISSAMAAMARSPEKIGYVLHEDGYVTATNPAAQEWLEMGIFDDLKSSNRRTYQEAMCSILGFPTTGLSYVLNLTEEEKRAGLNHLVNLGVDLKRPIVGIHTGGGGRWRLKQWTEDGFVGLISALSRKLENVQIVLFGGLLEKDMNMRINQGAHGSVFDSGCNNGVRHFSSLVNYCNVVLCSDSLAMHIALAMGRRVVVLFGPTSSAEIDLFGLGEKLLPDLKCLCCYKRECDFSPNCMESITVEMVSDAVIRQLALS